MIKSDKEFIKRIKLLEIDHKPEGYPCIKMKDISRLLLIIEKLNNHIKIYDI